MKKIELLFSFVLLQSAFSFLYPIHLLLIQKMKASTKASKASSLRIVAGSTKLLRSHLLSVQSECDKCNSDKCDGSAIMALIKSIGDDLKMVIRIQQVQQEKINKYWQSIRDGRKTVKRGAPASLESVTMETMIQMSLRFIQDLKDTLPELTQPIITRIHAKLHDLHDRLSLFQMFADANVECQCQCNRVGISCHACHQGAHEQCMFNCTE